MKPELMVLPRFNARESRGLALLALFGLLGPNAVFCYYFLTEPDVVDAALANPVSLVFIGEAFLLMFLFAWLLRRMKAAPVGGVSFIVMSLLGSMAFSVPFVLRRLLSPGPEASNK